MRRPMRRVAVIQARTGSTRLPGKVLRDLGGKPVLAWIVAAAHDSGAFDEVIVATTADRDDDRVAALATTLGARAVRGPVDDVRPRYLLAVDAARADVVVRLTSDCPLLDPRIIALCVRVFDPDLADYVTTDHDATIAHGFDVEVTTASVLQRVDALARDHDRNHVLSYVTTHPDEFRIVSVGVQPPSVDLRVTLDEPADADLLDAIVAVLGPRARVYEDVVALLRTRPDLVGMNAHVVAKPLHAG